MVAINVNNPPKKKTYKTYKKLNVSHIENPVKGGS